VGSIVHVSTAVADVLIHWSAEGSAVPAGSGGVHGRTRHSRGCDLSRRCTTAHSRYSHVCCACGNVVLFQSDFYVQTHLEHTRQVCCRHVHRSPLCSVHVHDAGYQNLAVLILDAVTHRRVFQGPVALAPAAQLRWMAFTDKQARDTRGHV